MSDQSPAPGNPSGPLVRVRAACEMLAISASTLNRWTNAGRLRRYKLGERTSAYRVSDLQDFIDSTLKPTTDKKAIDGNTQKGGRHGN